MPLVVLEARMWSVSVVVGVGVQLQARTVLEIVHLDGRAGWRARELRALSEVLLRASFVYKENIDVCEQHLEEVARDNSLRHGDGRWRGHHYSVDPSERRTEQTFGSTGPSRAKLERAGWNFQHFSEEIRFENDDSVLPAMAGIIAKRAESAEAAFKRPGQFHRRL